VNPVRALLKALRKLEAGYRIELSDEERCVYVESLWPNREVMDRTVNICLRSWEPGYGINFPPVKALVDIAEAVRADEAKQNESKRIAEFSGKKPGDWQESAEDRRNYIGELQEAIREKLAAGALAMKPYREIAEGSAAAANVESTIPINPAERALWASGMAAKQGWFSREQIEAFKDPNK
jgi:hypothetical protein